MKIVIVRAPKLVAGFLAECSGSNNRFYSGPKAHTLLIELNPEPYRRPGKRRGSIWNSN